MSITHNGLICFIYSVYICVVLNITYLADAMANEMVRKSPIAGSWYPGEKKQLQRQIEEYLGKAKPPAIEGRICALISPHAGMVYSGQAAASGDNYPSLSLDLARKAICVVIQNTMSATE